MSSLALLQPSADRKVARLAFENSSMLLAPNSYYNSFRIGIALYIWTPHHSMHNTFSRIWSFCSYNHAIIILGWSFRLLRCFWLQNQTCLSTTSNYSSNCKIPFLRNTSNTVSSILSSYRSTPTSELAVGIKHFSSIASIDCAGETPLGFFRFLSLYNSHNSFLPHKVPLAMS